MEINRNIRTEKAQGLMLSIRAEAITSGTVIRVVSVEQPGSGTVTVAGVVVVQDAIRSFLGKDYQFKTFFISASPTMAVVPINRAGTPVLLIPYCRLIRAKVSWFVVLW